VHAIKHRMITDIYLNPLELHSGFSSACIRKLDLGDTSSCTHDLHHDCNVLHSLDHVPPRTLRIPSSSILQKSYLIQIFLKIEKGTNEIIVTRELAFRLERRHSA
jgi:hypothetical protein